MKRDVQRRSTELDIVRSACPSITGRSVDVDAGIEESNPISDEPPLFTRKVRAETLRHRALVLKSFILFQLSLLLILISTPLFAETPEDKIKLKVSIDDREKRGLKSPSLVVEDGGARVVIPLFDDGSLEGDIKGDNIWSGFGLIKKSQYVTIQLMDEDKSLQKTKIRLPAETEHEIYIITPSEGEEMKVLEREGEIPLSEDKEEGAGMGRVVLSHLIWLLILFLFLLLWMIARFLHRFRKEFMLPLIRILERGRNVPLLPDLQVLKAGEPSFKGMNIFAFESGQERMEFLVERVLLTENTPILIKSGALSLDKIRDTLISRGMRERLLGLEGRVFKSNEEKGVESLKREAECLIARYGWVLLIVDGLEEREFLKKPERTLLNLSTLFSSLVREGKGSLIILLEKGRYNLLDRLKKDRDDPLISLIREEVDIIE